ncbi:hypothetical protein [Kitasatospora sp. NPDC094016]|uniref:hypothetical protein n=1 Tax=Kitasatospora sp. NPDC094016 TaxID=3154986 RepID=UPI00331A9903
MHRRVSTAPAAITALLTAGLLTLAQPAHAAGTADLYATLSASAVAGTVTYRTHFDNAGPDRAAGTVTATVTLPAQTTSATVDLADCAYDNGTKTVTCDLSGMPVGQGVIPVVTAQISPLALGTLTATARITGTDPDPDPANNTAAAPCTALTGLLILC